MWPESCYAGSATTAGNLVFVGRSTGDLIAYDARNGKQLWSFQTGAGANNAPTIFEQNGNQYVLFYAGGNALAASPHGDDLWLFGLDGTIGPAPAPGAGQGTEHAGESAADDHDSRRPDDRDDDDHGNAAGNAAAGASVFAENCATCHGVSGTGGNGGPDLTKIASAKNLDAVLAQVTNGGGGMPPFNGTLTDQQIEDVAAYVTQEITNKK